MNLMWMHLTAPQSKNLSKSEFSWEKVSSSDTGLLCVKLHTTPPHTHTHTKSHEQFYKTFKICFVLCFCLFVCFLLLKKKTGDHWKSIGCKNFQLGKMGRGPSWSRPIRWQTGAEKGVYLQHHMSDVKQPMGVPPSRNNTCLYNYNDF